LAGLGLSLSGAAKPYVSPYFSPYTSQNNFVAAAGIPPGEVPASSFATTTSLIVDSTKRVPIVPIVSRVRANADSWTANDTAKVKEGHREGLQRKQIYNKYIATTRSLASFRSHVWKRNLLPSVPELKWGAALRFPAHVNHNMSSWRAMLTTPTGIANLRRIRDRAYEGFDMKRNDNSCLIMRLAEMKISLTSQCGSPVVVTIRDAILVFNVL